MLRSALLSLAIFAAVASSPADASQPVWLLSTRCVDDCGEGPSAIAQIRYWRLGEDCDFQPSDADEFRATDSAAVPTVVFVHGNNTDAPEAVRKGVYVQESIRSQVGDKAFRFVIWSWPADRLHLLRNRSSSRQNAARCDAESYYLATWLSCFRPGVKVCLTGHSFGPRIIAGALHLLAGGELACRAMPHETVAAWSSGKRNPLRAVLMAGALDADSLAPCSRNGLALSLPEQVLITANPCDRVLHWYPCLWHRRVPEAMGLVGPCGIDSTGNVELIDVSDTVGKTHDYRNYASSPEVSCRWAHYAFLDDPPQPQQEIPADAAAQDAEEAGEIAG